MRRFPFAAALAAFIALAAPGAAAKLPCAEKDKACLLKEAKKNPVRTLDFWAKQLAKPIGERIGPAPQELVDYLEIDNALNGFREKPRAAKLSPEFLADVRGALDDLMPVIRKVAGPTFANGITKTMLHQEWSMTIEQAIEAEAQAQAICMMTEDFKRAYHAFVAKQRPKFEGD